MQDIIKPKGHQIDRRENEKNRYPRKNKDDIENPRAFILRVLCGLQEVITSTLIY